ncbi:MAG: PaaI family thioesterase [Bacteroidales bacterium]
MKHKVTHKQQNSRKCLVCGLNNEIGLKAGFFELENNELVSIFTPCEEHQSYPGRLHGGISAAILDETIGRAVMIGQDEYWGVTVELSLKFKKPVPLYEEIKVVGRITNINGRVFEGSGELILKNGDIAVTAEGKYIRMPLEKITGPEIDELDWKISHFESDPGEIEI